MVDLGGIQCERCFLVRVLGGECEAAYLGVNRWAPGDSSSGNYADLPA